MIGTNGSAYLHRIPVLTDLQEAYAEVERICDGGGYGPPPGANCTLALSAARRSLNTSDLYCKLSRRFQEGAIDELSFLGPDVGPLAAVLVGSETGTWYCEELDISSSRSGYTSRFVCRDTIGSKERPAAYITPVPPGGVVYGSGDAAVVLTRDEATRLRDWNLQRYSDLKARLLGITAILVGLGSTTTFAAAGMELAVPFALGGTSSLVYQVLLQHRVDGVAASVKVPAESSASLRTNPGLGFRIGLVMSNPAFRASLMIVGLAGSLAAIHSFGGIFGEGYTGGNVDMLENAASRELMGLNSVGEVRQVAAGLAGFLMQKVAVVWCSLLQSGNDGVESVPDWQSGGKKSEYYD